jgi:RHS repeat-associated protein
LGRWTQTTYNAIRQASIIRDPLGRKTFLQYCNCGGLRALTDANGRTTGWSYDTQGRVTAKNYPDGTATTYGYEAKTSRLKTVTDAKGQVATYSYLKDDALASVTYTGAAVATPTVSYTYDPYYPRPLTRIDGVGTTTYAYNPIPTTPTLGAGRLASVDGPWTDDTQTFAYDELGRVLTASVNATANQTNLGYDSLGRVTSVTNPLGAFGLGYVGATGRPAQRTYPNGQVTNYGYHPNATATVGTGNGDQRLSQIQNLKTAGGANLSTHGYGYDAEGMIKNWSRQIDADATLTSTFGYDAVDQLVSAVLPNSPTTSTSHLYRYDKGGNRTSQQISNSVTAAAHDAGNRVRTLSDTGPIRIAGQLSEPANVTVNGQSASVDTSNVFKADVTLPPGTNTVAVTATDGSGNTRTNNYQVVVGTGTGERTLTYDLNGNLTDDGAGRTFTWDAVNRLASITVGGNVTSFVYDGAGRRVMEKLNGAETRRWVWSGGPQPVEERDASNAVTKRFYAGLGEQVGGTGYFYTTDHLGSIRELTDGTGAVRARYNYTPYGERTKVSGDLDATFGFTGYLYHASSGLNLTLYRGYDAQLGRFISRDVIGERGGVNLYAYAGGNPVNFVDPNGDLFWFALVFLFVGTSVWVNAPAPGDPIYTGGSDPSVPEMIVGVAGLAQLVKATTACAIKSGSSLSGLTIAELNNLLKGAPRDALGKLFGNGRQGALDALESLKAGGQLPAGITRETLETYQEIAVRQIARGADVNGAQAVRLEVINEALKKL